MAENEVGFTFTGRDGGLDKTTDDAARGAEGLERKFDQAAAAVRRGQNELAKFVDGLERIHSTPVEKLAAAEDKLNAAVAAGLVSRERANFLLDASRAKLLATKNTVDASNVSVSATPAALGTAFAAAQAGFQTLGVTLGAGGVVQLGLSAIRAGLDELARGAEEAVQSLRSLEDPDKRLVQVATSAEDLAGLQATADRVAPQLGDRRTARELVFSARSQGFEGDVDTIAASRNVLAIPSAIELASASKKFEDTSVEQALNLGLAAAAGSKFNVEQLTSQVFKAAEGAQQNKAGASETFAATAVLAEKFEQSTGDRLKVFLAKAAQSDELKGKGLVAAFESLQALTPDKRDKFLGESVELNAVASALAETIGPIKALTAELDQAKAKSGQADSILAQRVGIAASNPQIAAREQLKRSELNLEIAREQSSALAEANKRATLNELEAQVQDLPAPTRAAVGVLRRGIRIPLIGSTGGIDDLPLDAKTSANALIGVASLSDKFFGRAENTTDEAAQRNNADLVTRLAAASAKLENAAKSMDAAAGKIGQQTPDERRRAQLSGAN